MPLTQTINVKNQFTAAGYTYDAAGNVLADGSGITTCSGSAYTWNAEEQMSCAAGATYLYDGDGIRVGKSGGAASPTLYWGAGTLVESDTSGNVTSEYIFLGGKRIARRDVSTGSVYYYFADALGSSNVVATAAGAIENESDFYPFGGESPVTDGLTNQHYKFEGKERDANTSSTAQPQGLDYFGARFDSSATGRFMSPDWANSPETVPYAKLGNPQSFNLYAFAVNNPESAPDLDGHEDEAPGGDAFASAAGQAQWAFETGGNPAQAAGAWLNSEAGGGQSSSSSSSPSPASPQTTSGAPAQQQNSTSTSTTQGQNTDYVSVSYWPKSAGGFGHIGVGVNTDDTQGYSTADPKVHWWTRLFGAPAGAPEDDLKAHTNSGGEVAPHSYLHIPISADQAAAMKGAMADRVANPGHYNLIFNNCAQFVESVLHAGGVSGVPHAEVFGPAVLGGILAYENSFR